MGVGIYFCEEKLDVFIFVVEFLVGELVEGFCNVDDGYIFLVYEKWNGLDFFDGRRIVWLCEFIECIRWFVDECGIFVGIFSGVVFVGVLKVIEWFDLDEDVVIVFIVCDVGWKYFFIGVWIIDFDEVVVNVENIIYF